MRRRRARAALLIGAAVVVAAAVVTLATDRRDLAFVNGVAPLEPVVTLRPHDVVCQEGVITRAPAASVQLVTYTAGQPGPPLQVDVHGHEHHRTVGSGRTASGYRTAFGEADTPVVAPTGEIRSDRSIDVCVENLGARDVALMGTPTKLRQSKLMMGAQDGPPLPGSLSLSFLQDHPVTLLAELPTALRRAALFHPPIVGAWTFWFLAAVMAIGVPLLLARAVSSAVKAGTVKRRRV